MSSIQPLTQLDRAGFSKADPYNRLERGGHFAAWEQPQLLQLGAARGIQTIARVATAALHNRTALQRLDC